MRHLNESLLIQEFFILSVYMSLIRERHLRAPRQLIQRTWYLQIHRYTYADFGSNPSKSPAGGAALRKIPNTAFHKTQLAHQTCQPPQ